MNEYQSYIHLSRYARWLEDKQRRETWEETVSRFTGFLENTILPKYDNPVPKKDLQRIHDAILNLEVMPSMRALMTAGPALERDNVAGYNCAYVTISRLRAFDEILYILMCGTGVGFSVERQYVQKLPTVPDEMEDTDTTIVVQDSKKGWAESYKQLISLLYAGQIPKIDVSKVRPAGTRLKTFGGRASGPEPLQDLFKFTIDKFKDASVEGRKLSTIECHDIVCKIAESVVVGGVRRCLEKSYIINTINGEKQIQDIIPGDKVEFDGKFITVLNNFDNGIQKTMNINMEDGSHHICTPEHKWFVYNHDTNQTEWRKTNELSEGNYSMLKPK